jgi:hypothetical protein
MGNECRFGPTDWKSGRIDLSHDSGASIKKKNAVAYNDRC